MARARITVTVRPPRPVLDSGPVTPPDWRPHDPGHELDAGTLTALVRVDQQTGDQGIVAKDQFAFDPPGHLSLWRTAGRWTVRLQDATRSWQISAPDRRPGQPAHLAVTFGPAGLHLYVDGTLEASDPAPKHGLKQNTLAWILGAVATHRTPGTLLQGITGQLVGRLYHARLYRGQMPPDMVARLAASERAELPVAVPEAFDDGTLWSDGTGWVNART